MQMKIRKNIKNGLCGNTKDLYNGQSAAKP